MNELIVVFAVILIGIPAAVAIICCFASGKDIGETRTND